MVKVKKNYFLFFLLLFFPEYTLWNIRGVMTTMTDAGMVLTETRSSLALSSVLVTFMVTNQEGIMLTGIFSKLVVSTITLKKATLFLIKLFGAFSSCKGKNRGQPLAIFILCSGR